MCLMGSDAPCTAGHAAVLWRGAWPHGPAPQDVRHLTTDVSRYFALYGQITRSNPVRLLPMAKHDAAAAVASGPVAVPATGPLRSILQRKANLHGHLVVTGLAVLDFATDLGYFEPAQVADRL